MFAALILTLATSLLPPAIPWNGQSRQLVVPDSDPWVTAFEKSGLTHSPSYDETVAWLRRLDEASPELKMVSIGRSAEGREVWMVIASRERAFTPAALERSGKPTLFVQGGIHSGEIDGKDAGMMLLRDMTVRRTKRELLDRANLLFVPIFNVDGHERSSRHSRINQRGPEISGWRTNARNLNLNRDYMKADAEEMQAMVRALDTWDPDLYVDVHVTDGADYQYDVTYGWNGRQGWSPAIAAWLDTAFRPAADRALSSSGHIPGPLIFIGHDLSRGLTQWNADPRFSTGYGDARHMAAILVENHSLKPYDQRVLGTYVFLEQAMRSVGEGGAALRNATAADRSRNAAIPLAWRAAEGQAETIDFLAIEAKTSLSPISGDVRVEYTGKPFTQRIPFRRVLEATSSVSRPAAWWVPAAWREVIAKLDQHGIRYERIASPREVDVEMYRLKDPKFAADQFEGRVRVSATPVAERRKERFPVGSIRVPADQPLGTLAALLLEPASPDSLFQWGYFNSVLDETEYFESYVGEPLAGQMLAADPALAKEFQARLESDPQFRSNPRERLHWFYARTPYFDQRAFLYPVGRE